MNLETKRLFPTYFVFAIGLLIGNSSQEKVIKDDNGNILSVTGEYFISNNTINNNGENISLSRDGETVYHDYNAPVAIT